MENIVLFRFRSRSGNINWVFDLGKWRKIRLYFFYSILIYKEIVNLFHMVLRDEHMDNYELFNGHEEKKRILRTFAMISG